VLAHFSNINYAFPLNMVTINLDYWKSLSKDQKTAMLKAAAETETNQWSQSETKTMEALAVIKENGFTISEPSPALSLEMDKAAAKIVDEFASNADAATKAILKKHTK
jgi:TRAP-type C4-dicarboxylate transport system substrate-binding protein